MVRSRKREGWEFPGGGVEDGEKPEAAALRETGEETGYNVALLEDHRIDENVVYSAKVTTARAAYDRHEISRIGVFYSLPRNLAFPREEYEAILELCLRDLREAREQGV